VHGLDLRIPALAHFNPLNFRRQGRSPSCWIRWRQWVRRRRRNRQFNAYGCHGRPSVLRNSGLLG
jgi:hypothetical protein